VFFVIVFKSMPCFFTVLHSHNLRDVTNAYSPLQGKQRPVWHTGESVPAIPQWVRDLWAPAVSIGCWQKLDE